MVCSKAIVRVAEDAKVTPYNADKIFWLIGSLYLQYRLLAMTFRGLKTPIK